MNIYLVSVLSFIFGLINGLIFLRIAMTKYKMKIVSKEVFESLKRNQVKVMQDEDKQSNKV